jgi:hypothetical protein
LSKDFVVTLFAIKIIIVLGISGASTENQIVSFATMDDIVSLARTNIIITITSKNLVLTRCAVNEFRRIGS